MGTGFDVSHFVPIDFLSILTSYSDSAGTYLVCVVPLRILYGHAFDPPPGMGPHVKRGLYFNMGKLGYSPKVRNEVSEAADRCSDP